MKAEHRYHLRGDIDLYNAANLRADLQTVIRSSGEHVLLDCTNLTFIDSTGVAVILEAHRELAFQQRSLRILNASDQPRAVFEMLGLADLLHSDTGRRHATAP